VIIFFRVFLGFLRLDGTHINTLHLLGYLKPGCHNFRYTIKINYTGSTVGNIALVLASVAKALDLALTVIANLFVGQDYFFQKVHFFAGWGK
jgi:hypothetical protein